MLTFLCLRYREGKSLRPDEEFDDPSDEEWAAWLLEYIRANVNDTKDGFTRKGLCERLDVQYNDVQKWLHILCNRKLIKRGNWGRNVERIVTPEYELCPADLTRLQGLVYDVLLRASTPTGRAKISFEAIAACHPDIKSGSVVAIIGSLESKGYVALEPRGHGDPRIYKILRTDAQVHPEEKP